MKIVKYIATLLTATVFWAGCSESLEETYEDYAGDGKIRYVSKCSDLSINPGWKRLSLAWTNGVDVTIEKIKVLWTATDIRDSVLLEPGTTSFDITNLIDETYRVDVCALDGEGRNSLVETTYGRPYTEAHEIVRSFTRGVTKFFKVKDNLILFTDKWNDNIVSVNLRYTGTDQNEVVRPLSQWDFGTPGILVIENVDTDKRIAVEREGKLEGCIDTIRFEDYVLGNERLVTADFKLAIERRYGFTDKSESELQAFNHFLDTVQVLEFDYDMTSFEDVLYCPNLKRMVLGKNRYMHPTYQTAEDMSILHEEDKNLNVLAQGYRLMGFTIERYNKHYFTNPWLSWYLQNVQEMGNPTLPELDLIPASEIDTITNTMKDDIGYDSKLYHLVDNDPTTSWEPLEKGTARTHEIVIELKNSHQLHGIKIAQKLFDPALDQKAKNYLPGVIKLEVSMNQVHWNEVAYVTESILGQSSGEVTLIPFVEPQEAKYVRATVVDQPLVNVFTTLLADISLY